MMATLREARVDMVGYALAIRDAWRAGVSGASTINVVIDGQKFTPPAITVPWARCTILHNSGTQSGFRGGDERYEYDGILTLQIFTPLADADGRNDALAMNDALVQLAREMLEGTRTDDAGVLFQKVTSREIGARDVAGWFQTNVVAEFKYEHVH